VYDSNRDKLHIDVTCHLDLLFTIYSYCIQLKMIILVENLLVSLFYGDLIQLIGYC